MCFLRLVKKLVIKYNSSSLIKIRTWEISNVKLPLTGLNKSFLLRISSTIKSPTSSRMTWRSRKPEIMLSKSPWETLKKLLNTSQHTAMISWSNNSLIRRVMINCWRFLPFSSIWTPLVMNSCSTIRKHSAVVSLVSLPRVWPLKRTLSQSLRTQLVHLLHWIVYKTCLLMSKQTNNTIERTLHSPMSLRSTSWIR